MWLFTRSERACRAFEARLEDHLEALQADSSARPEPALAAHLSVCVACREDFDLARAAGPLVRESAIRVPESIAANPFFAARVGARIREHSVRSGEFLPLLEAVSLRLMAAALSVALFLGVLSASGLTRPNRPAAAGVHPAGIGAVSPEVNPAPANPDAVVIALLTTEHER
ncbi:MAG TPA: hypothetical protein VMI93_02485 [Candidatus Solibacter sp.]|nr:hypothetical protein [Candidatus Solibacter sp.]